MNSEQRMWEKGGEGKQNSYTTQTIGRDRLKLGSRTWRTKCSPEDNTKERKLCITIQWLTTNKYKQRCLLYMYIEIELDFLDIMIFYIICVMWKITTNFFFFFIPCITPKSCILNLHKLRTTCTNKSGRGI